VITDVRQKNDMLEMKKLASIGLRIATVSLLTGIALTMWQVVRTYKALAASEEATNLNLSIWPMAIAILIAFPGFLAFIICSCFISIRSRAKRTKGDDEKK
jgi:TRAP-type C4-dicarboxylate transport system permease small subunit